MRKVSISIYITTLQISVNFEKYRLNRTIFVSIFLLMNVIEIYDKKQTMIVNLFAYICVIVDIHMGIDIRHAGKN